MTDESDAADVEAMIARPQHVRWRMPITCDDVRVSPPSPCTRVAQALRISAQNCAANPSYGNSRVARRNCRRDQSTQTSLPNDRADGTEVFGLPCRVERSFRRHRIARSEASRGLSRNGGRPRQTPRRTTPTRRRPRSARSVRRCGPCATTPREHETRLHRAAVPPRQSKANDSSVGNIQMTSR